MDSDQALFNVKRVKKRSTEVQTADALRDAIVSGGIPLGARLTEINVAEQLGVSRSTIRTAFHQLVQEGLIVQVPYTGWTVMTLSAKDAWELYTLRASLEALAARLVATRIRSDVAGGTVKRAVSRSFDDLKSACASGKKSEIATADMALHKTIVELSGHSRLVNQYKQVEHQILIYIRSSDALVSEPTQILSQHIPLIEAIISGKADAAMEFAMAHNESEGAILVNYLEAESVACA